MKWVKYRTKWSHGHGEFDWLTVPDDYAVDDINEEYIIPIRNENEWSEHFRGVEYEIAEPPAEIVDNFIKYTEGRISGLTKYLSNLRDYKKERYGNVDSGN